jgi:hypothetical protein
MSTLVDGVDWWTTDETTVKAISIGTISRYSQGLGHMAASEALDMIQTRRNFEATGKLPWDKPCEFFEKLTVF